MKGLDFNGYALSGCAAMAMLAGCGSSQPPIGAPFTMPQREAIATKTAQGQSWMSPDTKKADLLYVSDEGTSDVYVYSLALNRLVGTLTGFSEPRGICVNQAHDVWITNAGNSDVLEYAPGGTSPIATLRDPGQYPVDCSVDSKTGDLAVSNIISSNEGSGSLSIYQKAKGIPKVVPALSHTQNDGYDRAGNVFVDGYNSVGWPQFGELVRGGQAVSILKIKGAILSGPSGVRYSHGRLAIGDEDGNSGNSVIYQVTVRGNTATVVGTTQLRGSKSVIAFFILGHRVFCLNSRYGGGHIAVYDYPAGSDPIRIIHIPGLVLPTGLAVV